MNSKTLIKKIALSVVLTFAAAPTFAQDLIARQAPIDRRNNKLDTIVIKRLQEDEEIVSPSASLYNDWNTARTHSSGHLPNIYRIDLRAFHMPTPSRVITSNFGRRWGRPHKGLDIKVYIGDTIRSAFSGKVRVVGYQASGYGKYIVIRHSNGLETYYAHLSKQLVNKNQIVRAGEPIGLGGNTGRSTGSHLHFETRLCGIAINPALMFDFPNQDVTGDFYTYRRSTVDAESDRATALRGKSSSLGYSRENIQGYGRPKNFGKNKREVVDYSARQQYEKQDKIGQILYHEVVRGETLESIAKLHNVTVEHLCRLNRIGRYSKLTEKQLLKYSTN